MLVQFLVLFNGEKFVAVTWSNRVEKLSEVLNVTSFMKLEVGGYENDALVGKSMSPPCLYLKFLRFQVDKTSITLLLFPISHPRPVATECRKSEGKSTNK